MGCSEGVFEGVLHELRMNVAESVHIFCVKKDVVVMDGSDSVSRVTSNERVKQLQAQFQEALYAIEQEAPSELSKCLELVLTQMGLWQRSLKMEKWMESRLTQIPGITPRRLAHEARFYFKMPVSMIPYLIKAGRKVKTRMRVRQFRERLAADSAMTREEERNV